MLVRVECEYDIHGQFGGNNNQEIFEVPDELTGQEIFDLVAKELYNTCGYDKEELDGLLWITQANKPKTLGE